MKNHFPAFKPYIDQRHIQAVASCVEAGEISGNFGSALKDLEDTFSKLHNSYYSVTCSSGTSALHLACLGLGVDNSSTVVIPATTNMATFFAPMYNSAKIICCDVNQDDGLICLDSLENICKNTKVDFVMPVHLYGHVVSATLLSKLALKYNFKIIEDCAEAHFAKNDDGQYVGSSFDAGCFSFYANKIIASGEGGIVIFKDKEFASKAANFKNLSFSTDSNVSKFYHQRLGYNYRLTNLSAALVNIAICDRESIMAKRDQICEWYNQSLADCEYISIIFNQLPSYRVNWVFCVKFKAEIINLFGNKQTFLSRLLDNGVEARDFFYPADHQPFFKNYIDQHRPPLIQPLTSNSLDYYAGSIYLPVYLEMSRQDVGEICEAIKQTISALL